MGCCVKEAYDLKITKLTYNPKDTTKIASLDRIL